MEQQPPQPAQLTQEDKEAVVGAAIEMKIAKELIAQTLEHSSLGSAPHSTAMVEEADLKRLRRTRVFV